MSYLSRLLANNEEVAFTTRPHWTAFAGRAWWALLLVIVAAVAAVAVNLKANELFPGMSSNRMLALRVGAFVVLLAYPAMTLVVRYVRWRTEQYVVTNFRVIQLTGILAKKVLDSSLDKVNDVMLEQGLLGRILDYGNLEILTASELAVNNFRRVAHPIAFKTSMLNAKEAQGVAPVDRTKLIENLAHLRDQGVLTDEEFQSKKAKLLAEL